MSRIAGYVTWKSEDVGYRHEQVVQMLDTMPGDEKLVIDEVALSLGIKGTGGCVAQSDGFLVAIDGRVFNSHELHKITPSAPADDAGLILELCRTLGFEAVLQQINGDIAIVFFDRHLGRLWLGRDRFGVKPLYYILNAQGFGFASLPATLLSLPGVNDAIDRRYVGLIAGSHYRTFDNVPERSPFIDVGQLPAAHLLETSFSGINTLRPYWRLRHHALHNQDEEALAEQYCELLLDAVHRRLTIAKRPAFTLSGGMDSSSVLGCAVRLMNHPADAFSSLYVDPTYDERAEIHDVVEAGLTHWKPVELADNLDVFAIVQRLVGIHQEPVATATWLSHDLVSECVAEAGFDSLFGGLGGDELNAGEYEYFPLFFADLRAAGQEAQLAVEIARWAEYHDHSIYRKNAVIAERLITDLAWPEKAGYCRPNLERQRRYSRAVLKDFFDVAMFEPIMEHPFATCLANRAYQDLTRETTPCCLRAEDRQCSAHGLEHFDPFLDYRLVEFMFAVPGTMKIRNGVTKYLLRKAMQGILPETTRTRIKKTGWNAPAHRWLSGAGLIPVRDMVASRVFQERGIYDVAEVGRLIDEHERIIETNATCENHMMFLWQLLNLELWLQWLEKH